MKTFRLLFLTCIFGAFYFSCDKQPQNEIIVNSNNFNEYDSDFACLSNSLSKSINNLSLRKILKEEALKKFDGDFDILLINIEDKKISSQKSTQPISIKELLEENFPQKQKANKLK